MDRRACFLRLPVIALVVLAAGHEAAAADEDGTDRQTGRRERLQFMRQLLGEFRLYAADAPDRLLSHTKKPVLRWSNPVRNFFSDGAIFLWISEKRPVAAASISVRGEGTVAREFTSFTDESLRCVRGGRVVWSPDSAGPLDQMLPEAPAPSRSQRLRLVQMRRLARRFAASFREPGAEEFSKTRLLARPIYRYASRNSGILDGAVFAYAQANDPEMLLRLEARRSGGDKEWAWRYSLARMTSIPLSARLDGRKIWSVGYSQKDPRAPYIEVFEGKYAPPTDSTATGPDDTGDAVD